MTIYLIGGSSAVYKDGYVPYLKAKRPDLQNLSIGSSNTYMGVFRFLQNGQIGVGDTVLWSYSVGDRNAITAKNMPVDYILGALEHLICLTRDAGARFAALTFDVLESEEQRTTDENKGMFRDLFEHYGLLSFDKNDHLREVFGLDHLPPAFFRDGRHFSADPKINAAIADIAEQAVLAARVPKSITPKFIANQRLQMVFPRFTDTFANSLINLPMRRMPLTLNLPKRGRILAAIISTAELQGKFEVELKQADPSKNKFQTRRAQSSKQRKLLKAICFAGKRIEPWKYQEGARIRFRNTRPPKSLFEALRQWIETRSWPWSQRRGVQLAGVLVAIDETRATVNV